MQSIIESNAARLRKLHETMKEASLHRTEGPEALQAWSRAAREFQDSYDELAFPGGLRSGLRRIEAGDIRAVEAAIIYLELRPFYYRAQYNRNVFIRLLKRRALPSKLHRRFEAIIERLRTWRAAKRGEVS